MTHSRARVVWTLFALACITTGTWVAIRFAQGYRLSRTNLVAENGLLVANSTPRGARVLVNERFITATDDTLYLRPAEYDVEINKDGYFPWKKKVLVEQTLVTQANALLFPVAPSLSPLTFSGAVLPVPSPDGQRLLFYTASTSSQTLNGFYVLDLNDNPLAFQRGPRQVARDSALFSIKDTKMVWSPDSSQVLLVSPRKAVLLDPGRLNEVDTSTDLTFQLPTILSQWEEEMYKRDRQRLALFPPEIQAIATSSAVNVYFSPDEEKVIYTATESFTLAEHLLPAKPGSNTQPQARTTEAGGVYIYDRDEDRQFYLGSDSRYLNAQATVASAAATPKPTVSRRSAVTEATAAAQFVPQKLLLSNDLFNRQALSLQASPSAFTRLQRDDLGETVENFRTYHSPLFSHGYQWFPDSNHVITHDNQSISITEYDGTNSVKVYSGPFANWFVYPWPNGSRLIILTNFLQGEATLENLYTIDLK